MTQETQDTGQQFTPQTEAERVMVDFIQMVATLNKVNNSTVKALSKSAQGLLARLDALQAQEARGERYTVATNTNGNDWYVMDTHNPKDDYRYYRSYKVARAHADRRNAATGQADESRGGAS